MNTNLPFRMLFSSLNFLTQVESLQSSLEVGESLTHQSDLCFLIGAPTAYSPSNTDDVTLFVDQAGQQRELPSNCYQLTSLEPMSTEAFMLWSQQSTQMLRDTLMYPGLVCVDWTDLQEVLQASKTRRLILQSIDYDKDDRLPLAALQQLRFGNLFAGLFGGADLGLCKYTELADALEHISPSLQMLKVGMLIHPCQATRLLLLGEPA